MDYSDIALRDLPKPPTGKHGWPWDDSFGFPRQELGHGTSPKVVIVTPSFNQAIFIEETIRSVILQGYSNLEYWVMDGGSTDGTKDVLEKYTPWLTGWKSGPDQGQTDAINKVWSSISGEFYGWINSDDMFAQGALHHLVSYFKEHPEVGYVYGDLEIINEESEITGLRSNRPFDFLQLVKEAGWISQPGSLISGKALEQIGLLDSELRLQMDLDLWFRAGLYYKFGHIAKPLARYRKHAFTKTKTQQSRAAYEIIYIYRKLFDTINLPKEMREVEPYAFASAHLYAAYRLLNAGDFQAALAEIWSAVESDARVVFSRRFLRLPKAIVLAGILTQKGQSGRCW